TPPESNIHTLDVLSAEAGAQFGTPTVLSTDVVQLGGRPEERAYMISDVAGVRTIAWSEIAPEGIVRMLASVTKSAVTVTSAPLPGLLVGNDAGDALLAGRLDDAIVISQSTP